MGFGNLGGGFGGVMTMMVVMVSSWSTWRVGGATTEQLSSSLRKSRGLRMILLTKPKPSEHTVIAAGHQHECSLVALAITEPLSLWFNSHDYHVPLASFLCGTSTRTCFTPDFLCSFRFHVSLEARPDLGLF